MVQYPLCGRIINTHGCRGEVKIESFCDSPEVLLSLPKVFFQSGSTYLPRRILSARVHKGYVLALLEGITDMDTARSYQNRDLFADRSDLPLAEGKHLLCDLLGLPVIDADSGKIYGRITHIESGSAYDMYEIETEAGKVLFPAVRQFVREIREDAGIYITPIEGMFP